MQLSCSFILSNASATIHATNCRGVHPRLTPALIGFRSDNLPHCLEPFRLVVSIPAPRTCPWGRTGVGEPLSLPKVPTSKRNVSPALPTLPSGQTIDANLIDFRLYREVHSIVDRSRVG